MSEPIWRIGSLYLPLSSLMFYAAVVLALALIYFEGRRKLLPESRLIDFLLLSLLGGMIGGRLIHAAIFDPHYYFGQPVRLLYIQDCGFSLWGGLISAIVLISIWAYRGNMIVERYLDAAAPALAFCFSLGYVGAHLQGRLTTAAYPWLVACEDGYCHPDGAYAIILLMLLYVILKERRWRAAYEGELFFWFLLGYSVINILLDFLRDLPLVWSVFTAGQLFSMVLFIVVLIFIVAGSQIALSASYLSRTLHRPRPAERTMLFLWHLILTGVMVLSYYFIHQTSTFL